MSKKVKHTTSTKKAKVEEKQVTELMNDSSVSSGSLKLSMNTEDRPVPPPLAQAPPCILCRWFNKRMENTAKEQVKHVEMYHMDTIED